MKIGIAGYGYVGMAHELILKENHKIVISDPAKGHNENLNDANAIIVCVSTPSDDKGYCDVNNIKDVIDNGPNVPYLIKSTMTCEGWRLIKECKNKNITYSPEFLRARHWSTDILNNKDWYFGGNGATVWAEIFKYSLQNINVNYAEPEELIIAKQLRNSFLALKVTYFNQAYDFCKAQNVDFDSVRAVVTADPRIGESHSLVTDDRGYGGHCFPKDVLATIKSSQLSGKSMTLLEQSDIYNKKIKNDKI